VSAPSHLLRSDRFAEFPQKSQPPQTLRRSGVPGVVPAEKVELSWLTRSSRISATVFDQTILSHCRLRSSRVRFHSVDRWEQSSTLCLKMLLMFRLFMYRANDSCRSREGAKSRKVHAAERSNQSPQAGSFEHRFQLSDFLTLRLGFHK
jgi:hypothetical protein